MLRYVITPTRGFSWCIFFFVQQAEQNRISLALFMCALCRGRVVFGRDFNAQRLLSRTLTFFSFIFFTLPYNNVFYFSCVAELLCQLVMFKRFKIVPL